MTFGECLRKLREDDERSQSYVARKCGIPQSQMSALEADIAKPSAKVLAALAAHYKRTMDELWAGSYEGAK